MGKTIRHTLKDTTSATVPLLYITISYAIEARKRREVTIIYISGAYVHMDSDE